MAQGMNQDYPALRWQGDCLELLDQRLLPHDIRYLRLQTAAQVAAAISDMVVRGAPAIGIAAAYGAAIAARQLSATNNTAEVQLAELEPALGILALARPTAVNLHWALKRVREVVTAGGDDVAGRIEQLAVCIHEADIEDNRRLGGLGAQLLPEGVSIYTHCNAGALATGGYGTALGVIRAAHEQCKVQQVYAGETRPWLQGSRLTAWELQQSGIPVKLAIEGAAGSLMRRGLVDWVIVGADRVARNGDVANKIGTYNLAVLARHHGVRFMVALPTSTIDMEALDGEDIPIEERPSGEVTQFRGVDIAPHGIDAVNPVFDITPAELVDVLVTEKGVVERPDAAALARLMEKH
jgi:methylthioribose-1-phosphate isomerase